MMRLVLEVLLLVVLCFGAGAAVGLVVLRLVARPDGGSTYTRPGASGTAS